MATDSKAQNSKETMSLLALAHIASADPRGSHTSDVTVAKQGDAAVPASASQGAAASAANADTVAAANSRKRTACGAGLGKSPCSKRTAKLTAECISQRRKKHNEVEIRRRKRLNERFAQLRELTGCKHSSKISVLDAVICMVQSKPPSTTTTTTTQPASSSVAPQQTTPPVAKAMSSASAAEQAARTALVNKTLQNCQERDRLRRMFGCPCLVCGERSDVLNRPCGHLSYCSSCVQLLGPRLRFCAACSCSVKDRLVVQVPNLAVKCKSLTGGCCVLCEDNAKNVVLVPCGHFLHCLPCVSRVKNCPLCLQQITSREPLRCLAQYLAEQQARLGGGRARTLAKPEEVPAAANIQSSSTLSSNISAASRSAYATCPCAQPASAVTSNSQSLATPASANTSNCANCPCSQPASAAAAAPS